MGIKEYLPHDVINKAILSNYSFKVYNILPIKFKDTDKQRAVYKIETDAGPKCLKKVYFNEASLLFVYSVMEWLFNAGINIPTMLPTKHGGRYIKYKN
ncbi:MAG TPA: CotS family spore coat protein, partial [Clostridiaceae bacterium]|nr:CotS family spore coat protein [Clostridiaceae bacterium]